MRTQKHNQGNLTKLHVNIESEVVTSIEHMAEVTGMSVDEIVVIALKRYRSAHSDLEGKNLQAD